MAPAAVLSLRPSTFVQGGLIDDVNGTIREAKFMIYDYNGKSDVAVPALGIEIELEDGTKNESYYSAGDSKYWAPSGDGKTLVATGDKTSLTTSCKLGIFLAELVAAGFSEDKLGSGDITCLVGLKAHFARKADAVRKGLVRKADDKEQSTLVVTKIISMSGETAKAGPKAVAGAPAAATTAATTAAATTSDVDDDATSLLMELLPLNGGSIAKNKLSQLVFKAIGKDHALVAKKSAITSRVFNDGFLQAGATNGLWEFDGTTVKIG